MIRAFLILTVLVFTELPALAEDHLSPKGESSHVTNGNPPYGERYNEYWKPRYDAIVSYFQKFRYLGQSTPPKILGGIELLAKTRAALAQVTDPSMEERHLMRLLDDHAVYILTHMKNLKTIHAPSRKEIIDEVNRRGKMVARYLVEKGREQWTDSEKQLFEAMNAVADYAEKANLQDEALLKTDFQNENLNSLLKTVALAKSRTASANESR